MSEFTPKQQSFLQQDKFISEVLIGRSTPTKAEPSISSWQSFFQTASGAALITVLIGGLGGTVIAGKIQNYSKYRETAALRLTDNLKNQQNIYNDAFSLVGKTVSVAEDLTSLLGNAFSTRNGSLRSSEDLKRLNQQKVTMLTSFNVVDTEWRQKRDTFSLLMRVYHHNDITVGTKWDAVASTLTDFVDCEQHFYGDHYRDTIPQAESVIQNQCKVYRIRLTQAESEFTAAVSQTAQVKNDEWWRVF